MSCVNDTLGFFCSLVLLVPCLAEPTRDTSEAHPLAGAVTIASGESAQDFQKLFTEAVSKLPDGANVEEKDFQSVLGPSAAKALNTAGATRVSNHGGRIRLELRSDYGFNVKGVDVKFKTLIEFNARQSGDLLEFSDIVGIEANKVSFLPQSELKKLTLVKEASGNTKVTAKVKIFGVFPKTYHVTLGPDGKPLPKKR